MPRLKVVQSVVWVSNRQAFTYNNKVYIPQNKIQLGSVTHGVVPLMECQNNRRKIIKGHT